MLTSLSRSQPTRFSLLASILVLAVYSIAAQHTGNNNDNKVASSSSSSTSSSSSSCPHVALFNNTVYFLKEQINSFYAYVNLDQVCRRANQSYVDLENTVNRLYDFVVETQVFRTVCHCQSSCQVRQGLSEHLCISGRCSQQEYLIIMVDI